MVGVDYQDVAVAFPFSVLNSEPVVNHEIGNIAILVVFNAKTGTGVVFNRNLDVQILTFEVVEGLTLMDQETESIWDGLIGAAIDGPLM